MESENTPIDILYCFDVNYNIQAFSSMISLLDCIDRNINIHIIHNNKKLIKLPKIISNHNNLESVSIYEFHDTHYDFPNLSNSHISVATYYRIFIDNYLPKNLKSIIYIDSDMIFVRNPRIKLQKELGKLKNSEFTIAAKTEINATKFNPDELERLKEKSFFLKFWPFDRLPIKEKYFNAGFLIIDMIKWRENKTQNKLITTMKEQYENILMWDQDVLNCVFNGDYQGLTSEFNCEAYKLDKNSELPYVLHFSGSNKPWKTNGAFVFTAKYYHANYKKFSNIDYHIEIGNKKNSFKHLLNSLLKFQLFKIPKPLTYLIIYYKTLVSR